MPGVRSPFGNQENLATGRSAKAGIRIIGGHPEFLNALRRSGNRPFGAATEIRVVVGIAGDAIGDVAAIQQNGVLIALRSRNLSAE